MERTTFDKLLHFLLGASWAVVLMGALLVFKIFFYFGIAMAIFAVFVFVFFALFAVLALDAFAVNKERLKEAKKQTKLLEKIASSGEFKRAEAEKEQVS